MNDFTIQEETGTQARPDGSTPKGLYKLVISLGLAKDMNGARIVLILVAVAAIVLAVLWPILFA